MTKRKAKTALVFNPSGGRQLSINGSRRKAKGRRRSNPVVKKTVARRRNPSIRRRSNPITSASALIATAAMAGVGVSLFDVAASYLIPNTSSLVRVGVKLGGAWAINSYGSKLPVLGKYKSEIALVILTSAAIDVMKLYLFPVVAKAAASFGLGAGGGGVLSPAPAADDGNTAGLYGEWNVPAYQVG